jgi:hypothetical protein
MPFQLKTFAFDEYTIRQLVPTGPGVYGIANSENWICIGAAHSLESVLLRHLSQTDSHMMQRNPSVFTWEKSLAEDRMERKNALIEELKPLFKE